MANHDDEGKTLLSHRQYNGFAEHSKDSDFVGEGKSDAIDFTYSTYPLSRIDSKDLLEKLGNNYFTGEAKFVAAAILRDRGFDLDAKFKTSKSRLSEIRTAISLNRSFAGHSIGSILAWIAAVLLLGKLMLGYFD
ncbi:MAG: hypothetical protein ACKOWD_16395 [Rhodoferax sp.]